MQIYVRALSRVELWRRCWSVCAKGTGLPSSSVVGTWRGGIVSRKSLYCSVHCGCRDAVGQVVSIFWTRFVTRLTAASRFVEGLLMK